MSFPVNIAKFLRTIFFYRTPPVVLLKYYQITIVVMEPTPLQLGTGK